MNRDLSICIPTYNRALILESTLIDLIQQIEKYSIPIFVSDNASTDNTKSVVLNLKRNYPYIYYSCNVENLGLDKNFEAVLGLAGTRYRWLLGDDDRIRSGAVDNIMRLIDDEAFDFIILNGGIFDPPFVRVTDVPTNVYSDKSSLMADLGWHTTWMSSLIYSSKAVTGADYEPYYGTYFLHVGCLFNYLSNKQNIRVYWSAEPSFYPGTGAKLSWASMVFEIFAKNWTEVILSLPDSYSQETKLKCIKDHGVKSKLFSFVRYCNLRALGYYNVEDFIKYYCYFKYTTQVPRLVLLILSLFPRTPLQIIRRLLGK